MTVDQIIDGVIVRESEKYTNIPGDKGGPTKFGITAKTLGAFRMLGRQATAAEVRALTRGEAALIYRLSYVEGPGFERIAFEPLRVQLIDFGVNSGPKRAIRWLQRVCRVTPVDGVLGKATAAAVNAFPFPAVLNDALVAARLFMIDATTDAPQQKQFEEGLENRALSFFLARPAAPEVTP